MGVVGYAVIVIRDIAIRVIIAIGINNIHIVSAICGIVIIRAFNGIIIGIGIVIDVRCRVFCVFVHIIIGGIVAVNFCFIYYVIVVVVWVGARSDINIGKINFRNSIICIVGVTSSVA